MFAKKPSLSNRAASDVQRAGLGNFPVTVHTVRTCAFRGDLGPVIFVSLFFAFFLRNIKMPLSACHIMAAVVAFTTEYELVQQLLRHSSRREGRVDSRHSQSGAD